MNLINDLVVSVLKSEGKHKLEHQLLIPHADLHKVAEKTKVHLRMNQADDALQDLTDGQMISLAKAFDQSILEYVEDRLHI